MQIKTYKIRNGWTRKKRETVRVSHKGVITIWICNWANFAYVGNSVDAIISTPAAAIHTAALNLQLQTNCSAVSVLTTTPSKLLARNDIKTHQNTTWRNTHMSSKKASNWEIERQKNICFCVIMIERRQRNIFTPDCFLVAHNEIPCDSNSCTFQCEFFCFVARTYNDWHLHWKHLKSITIEAIPCYRNAQ